MVARPRGRLFSSGSRVSGRMSQSSSSQSPPALAKRSMATRHISPAAPMKTIRLVMACFLLLPLSERIDGLLRGALAGVDRAVHVAAVLDARLGARPVDAPHRVAQRGRVAREGAGRARGDAPVDPRLVRPVLLDVV